MEFCIDVQYNSASNILHIFCTLNISWWTNTTISISENVMSSNGSVNFNIILNFLHLSMQVLLQIS
jgi:hypothetical protein